MKSKFSAIFAQYKGSGDELIPILQHVQNEYGYVSREAMLEVAKFARVSESKVYSVATFYAQFRFTPIGKKHVMVCRGTACHVRGAPKVLQDFETQLGVKEGETSSDGEYSLETVACIGCCGLAPCAMVDQQVEAKLTTEKVKNLVKNWSTAE